MTHIIPESTYRATLAAKHTHARRRTFWMVWACASGVVLLLAGFFWALFYSSFFKVTAVEIVGTGKLSREAVYQTLASSLQTSGFLGALGPDNIFFWELGQKYPDTKISMPVLASADISVDLFARRVNITVNERKVFGVWCVKEGKECFSFDEGGVVFAPAPNTFGTLLLKIQSEDERAPVLGESVFRIPEWLSRITETLQSLNHAGTPVSVVRVKELSLREWEAVLPSGAALYFNFDFVPIELTSVLKDFIARIKIEGLTYIDFRVPGRMYYK
ncbi:MAG: hypothetical protein AAB631_01010 [Patescibacteria group bacterium]